MRVLFMIAALMMMVAPVRAAELVAYKAVPAGAYALDKNHASLTFKVSHMGLSDYVMRFKDFDAALDYDPADVSKSTLSVTINPLSIETDHPAEAEKSFNAKLGSGENWLDGGAFPAITFTSTKVTRLNDNTGSVTGDLTMLGVTKPVTLNVEFNGAYLEKPFAGVPAIGFSAFGTFKRSDWGLDTYVPTVGDDVTFMIETEFHKVMDDEQ